MTDNVRAVPVLKLRGPSSALSGDLTNVFASAASEAVLIPLRHTRQADDLLIQYRVRALGAQSPFSVPSPVHVLFRNKGDQPILMRTGPMLYFAGKGAQYQALSIAGSEPPSPGAWLGWGVRWDRGPLGGWYASAPNHVATAYLDAPPWPEYPLIEGIVVASSAGECMVSELRLWERRHVVRDGLGDLLDRRLDGREVGLIGYWKFDEGQGVQIGDSSRFARHGKLAGGQWINPAESGLTLDCTLDDVRRVRRTVQDLARRTVPAQRNVAAIAQNKDLLASHVSNLQQEKDRLAAELATKLAVIDKQIAAENARHERWQKDIQYLGTVSLDRFSEEIARETNGAVKDSDDSAYRLERVALEVKVLPVHDDREAGVKDYRVMFPDADAQIDPQQLSTLRFAFEVRPPEPEPSPLKVPDVRGYTELAAQRKLREAGLRANVMEQATDDPEKIGRVVMQIVEEEVDNERVVKEISSGNVLVQPNSVVTLFLGRASDGGARGMSAGNHDPGT